MSSPLTGHHMNQYLADFAAKAEAYQASVTGIRGESVAGDGLVRVTADAAGKVVELTINPRAMRLDSMTMTEYLLEAIGGAQSDARAKLDEAAAEMSKGSDALAAQAGLQARIEELTSGLSAGPQDVVRTALAKLKQL